MTPDGNPHLAGSARSMIGTVPAGDRPSDEVTPSRCAIPAGQFPIEGAYAAYRSGVSDMQGSDRLSPASRGAFGLDDDDPHP
jgi:hypothetical protein